jgi:hypothetical protein
MSEWLPTVDGLDGVDELSVKTRPVPRMIRRSALRPATSRRDLYADAQAQARLVRGRNAFVWRDRMLPVGIPLAAAAGVATWRRRGSARDTLTAIVGVAMASYLEARVEWSVRRRAYRRRRGDE